MGVQGQEGKNVVSCILASLLFVGCRLDENQAAQDAPNKVSYRIDGVQVEVEEGLSYAFLDKTKQIAGPSTHLYFEAGVRSETPDKILGDKLQINIPATMKNGTYPVRFMDLPGKDHVWVSYRHSQTDVWTAMGGLLTIEEAGGVGGRLRANFDRLELGNPCGEHRVLEDGIVDVRIGSEDSFPVSEIDTSEGSEWDLLDATRQIENNMLFDLDGMHFACDWASFVLGSRSTEDSGTTESETGLAVESICGCHFDPLVGRFRSQFSFAAYIPASGEGMVATHGSPYFAYLLIDVNDTPDEPSDDDVWYAVDSPSLYYRQIGTGIHEPVDIEVTSPITFAYVDQSGDELEVDESQTITMTYAHAYGLINEE